jgi:glutamate racemase
LVGSAQLAGFAEREMAGHAADDAALAAEISPCFVEDGAARTDTVVLACTHFPLLTERFARLAPWPVRWIDPAPAIARRMIELIGPPTGGAAPTSPRLVFTSGRIPSGRFAQALQGFGFDSAALAGAGSFDTHRISP